MERKKIFKLILDVVSIVIIILLVQSFTFVNSSDMSANSTQYKKFVKTKNKCTKSNCSCSGYWGYMHLNGTYEGNCLNTDGHGHRCGHGPEKHGLKKW